MKKAIKTSLFRLFKMPMRSIIFQNYFLRKSRQSPAVSAFSD